MDTILALIVLASFICIFAFWKKKKLKKAGLSGLIFFISLIIFGGTSDNNSTGNAESTDLAMIADAPVLELTETPTPDPTAAPDPDPTAAPTPDPTATPDPDPTAAPDPDPTAAPTPDPTAAPTPDPTAAPDPIVASTPDPTIASIPDPVVVPTPDPVVVPVPDPVVVPVPDPVVVPVPDLSNVSYVLNTSSGKIHLPSCKSVRTIKPENYGTSDKTIDELLSEGYTRCGNCLE